MPLGTLTARLSKHGDRLPRIPIAHREGTHPAYLTAGRREESRRGTHECVRHAAAHRVFDRRRGVETFLDAWSASQKSGLVAPQASELPAMADSARRLIH